MDNEQDIPSPPVQDPPGPGDDPLQKLYEGLHSKQMYTKSFQEFKTQYSTPEAIDKLYNGLNSQQLYTKEKGDFYAKYFPAIKQGPQASSASVQQTKSAISDLRNLGAGMQGPEVSRNPAVKPFAGYEQAIEGYSGAQNRLTEINRRNENLGSPLMGIGDSEIPGLQEQSAKLKKQITQEEVANSGTLKTIEQGLLRAKDFDSYFDKDGTPDYGKIHDYALQQSREFGGDRAVGEVLYNRLANAAKFQKLKPDIDAQFRTMTGKAPEEYYKDTHQLAVGDLTAMQTHYNTDFEAEVKRSQNVINDKASAVFQQKYQPQLQQVADQFGQNSPEFKQASDNAKEAVNRDLQQIQTKENQRLIRIRAEMGRQMTTQLQQAGGNGDDKFNSLYSEAYKKAQAQKETDRSKVYDEPMSGGSPMTLFGKSIWSGLNSWAASRGSGLVAMGMNNPVTDWLRSRQGAAEGSDVPDLPLNMQNALNPQAYATRVGKMTGAMAPDLAASLLLKSPLAGGLEFFGSATLGGAGDVYNQAKAEGASEAEAQSKAKDFVGKNMASLPGYLIMSAAMKASLSGAGKLLSNTLKTSVGGLASALPQQYAQQSETKEAKPLGEFMSEDAPQAALENLVTLAAAAPIMHGIGVVSKAMQDAKVNSVQKQFYSDLIDKHGPNMANAVLEMNYLNGTIDEKTLAQNKVAIADMVKTKASLEHLGVGPDGQKLYLELQGDIRNLKGKAESVTDETVKKMISGQVTAKENQAKEIAEGKAAYAKLTTSESTEFVMPVDKAVEALANPHLQEDLINGKTTIEAIGDPEQTKPIHDFLSTIKEKQNAIQKQSAGTDDVRNTSGDSKTVVGRDEKEGAVSENPASESTGPAQGERPAKLLVARHARSVHDEENRVSGQNKEPLSDQGVLDAQELAREVRDNHAITRIVSSDLPRARQTADIVSEGRIPTRTDPAHRSWDLKDFSGMEDKAFKKIQRWFVENPSKTKYAGPDEALQGKEIGESFDKYAKRVIEARQEVEKEGPGTLLIDHSNNMNIWDAYKANGDVWDANAAQDYLSRKSPEPARIQQAPEERDVAREVANGTIPESDLLEQFKKAVDETTQSIRTIREGDTAETGDTETDGKPGPEPAEGSDKESLPESGEGKATDQPDKGTEPVSSDTGTSDKAKPLEAAVPLVREFIEHDVKPLLAKVAGNIRDAVERIVKVLSPRTGVEEKALTHIMKALGGRNKFNTLIDANMKSFEKLFRKMPDRDRIAFIDKLKTGQRQGDPTMDAIAHLLRKLDKNLYDAIIKYNPSLSWKENHYRVMWKVIPGTTTSKIWSIKGRRPLEGSKGFMKQATLTDMSEGIAKGGEPYSTNPITMFKMAFADGLKYITAQQMFEGLKNDKYVKPVMYGQKIPDGFVKLNDRIANIYFKGEYYIQEGAGRLLNNYLSRDLIRETIIGRGMMEIKNLFTLAELGLSGFHAVAEGLEAISSQLGLGLRKMINEGFADKQLAKVGEGALDILKSPLAFRNTFKIGRGAYNFTSSDEFRKSDAGTSWLKAFPETAQYIDDMFQGGGLMSQNDDFKVKTLDALKEHAGKNNYIGAALRTLPAMNEWLMDPLFNVYIPNLKIGMFFKEFPTLLAENKGRLAKGDVTREQLARKTIDFIDDRLGEMNFDNLFWNRTFKTGMQFMMRSVTWKLGNLRGMIGAPLEQGMEFYNAARENRAPRLMPKMAWLFGLSIMQASLSTVIQHLLAHKDLEDFRDLVAPRINPDDDNERVIMPTYYKDALHLWHNKLGYITGSMAGQISRFVDIWNNKDFYNYEIYDPHAPFFERMKDKALYAMPKPFSVTSAMAMHDKGEPFSKQAMSFLGLVKAPGYLTHSPIQNEIFDLYNLRNTSVRPHDEKEANETKGRIRELYRDDKKDEAEDMVNEAIKKGILRPGQIKALVKSAGSKDDPSVYFFKQLPFEDKKYLYEKMTEDEQQTYDPKGNFGKQLEDIEKRKNE